MESSKINRRRSRRICVEFLEGRALLSTAASSPPVVQPMGAIHNVPIQEERQGNAATANDALDVGKQYSNVVLSPTSRAVGWSLAKSAFKLDVNSLANLPHSSAVKRIGQSLSHLGKSSQVQAIGHSIDSFGTSVSHQFQKLFG